MSIFRVIHLAPSNVRVFALFLCGVLFSGCASKSLYYWGSYEEGLYLQMVKSNPEKAFSLLSKTIAKAEKGQLNVAPGLYAEYGFLLYQQGKAAMAAGYFRKEAEAFPESSRLMKSLIDRIDLSKENNDDADAEKDNTTLTPDS